ncbi:uncharacterized protein LOC133201021 [Saccostrea echinata]|uniref:uncharacterized protein LOC133201021 n=1 Tax=Saccostrea echinata TaxID=191078 RepID=UPI002A7F8DC4|nr:uncharacterized protein LOC133201021 [Saccostrea echinata]
MEVTVYFFALTTLVSFIHAQPWSANLGLGTGSKGPELKLTVGRKVGNWNFKGFGSTDFAGGWKAGVSVGIKFKRSTVEIPRRYDIVILANPCRFHVYNSNDDDVITMDEMTELFENPELGTQLFNDLDANKDWEITKSEFSRRVPFVIKECSNNQRIARRT